MEPEHRTEGAAATPPAIAAMIPVIEAVLFASPEPLPAAALARIFGTVRSEEAAEAETAAEPASPAPETTPGADATEAERKQVGARATDEPPTEKDVREALRVLAERTRAEGRGITLVEVANGWQFLTRDEYFPYVRKIAKTRAEERLSPSSIETLAVVAYKQPVTRAEVDAIRGAQSGPHLRSLMDRGLVRVTGRADIPGAPFHYGTTKFFLKHFGLKSTKDLPDPKELTRILGEQGRAVPVHEPRPAAVEASIPAEDPGAGPALG